MPEAAVAGSSSCHCTLPAEGPGGMQMTDGDSQRVGRVHRLGRDGELKQPRYHMLHLLLFGAPITDNRRLDGQGRVFSNFKSRLSGGQHGDSTDLSQLERGL